jgi:hypothetical protein
VEEGVQQAPMVWHLFACYYSLKAANYSVILKHFEGVWHICGKMIFTPMKDKLLHHHFYPRGRLQVCEMRRSLDTSRGRMSDWSF